MKQNLLLLLLSLSSMSILAQQTIVDYIPNDTPNSRYSVHSDGTVTDNYTGLMWKQCSEGLSGTECIAGSASDINWSDALMTANNSNFASYTDWRLPNSEELRSILAYDRINPSINSAVFPNTISDRYWSSSPYVANSSNDAWRISFGSGDDGFGNRSLNNRVRLVRVGQSFLSVDSDNDANWDVDGSGTAEALTDGLLMLRYLFGFRGDTLINGAVASSATRLSAVDIETTLETLNMSIIDIDNNGTADALTDGVLLLRYLFGFRGDALTNGAIALSGAARETADDIETYIQSNLP